LFTQIALANIAKLTGDAFDIIILLEVAAEEKPSRNDDAKVDFANEL
jgi:hypothetical protein